MTGVELSVNELFCVILFLMSVTF